MVILLKDIGRRYNRDWIFRHIDFEFEAGKSYAVLGPNGSGKSTLLKTLMGSLSPSEGQVTYSVDNRKVNQEEIFKHIALAAPYVDLIEEFTLEELLDFYFKFKAFSLDFDKSKLIALLGLQDALQKQIKHFSSGMKQRVKLGMAFVTRADILFLDEPTSNLDAHGEQWYLDLFEATYVYDRSIIIGSNQQKEYEFCDLRLHLSDYKAF